MSMFRDRGQWPKKALRQNLKPGRPWTMAGHTDLMVDELDAFGLDDSGLFMITIAQKKLPFQGPAF